MLEDRKNMLCSALLIILIPGIFLTDAFAQSDPDEIGAESEANYKMTYDVAIPDVTSPVTLEVEHHVYSPGDEVKIKGFVWMDLVERIDISDALVIESKDGQGNTIARENTTVGPDGRYEATFALLESANKGTYTVQARIELEADALGVVKAITSAALQSSTEFAVAESAEYKVNVEDQEFTVLIASNSGVNAFQFNQEDKKVSFFVEGNDGTTGITEIKIPKSMLSGDLTVLIDQNVANVYDVLLKSDTASETALEINYKHSIHRIEVAGTNVVPEFPVALLVMAITIGSVIVASIILRRRLDRGFP